MMNIKLAYDSRIVSTRNLVEAIKQTEQKPKAFICSSAVGIYGNDMTKYSMRIVLMEMISWLVSAKTGRKKQKKPNIRSK